MKKLLKDKNGAALTIAIILIVVSAFVVTALLWYASFSMNQLETKKSSERAEYIARSGIYAAYNTYFRNAAMFTQNETSAAPVYVIKTAAADGTETISFSSSSSTAVQNPLPANCIGYFIIEVQKQYIPYTGAQPAIRFVSTGTAGDMSMTVSAYAFNSSKLYWE
jgi:hypothetical protein